MAEPNLNGRIIIDARGTEKNVLKPVASEPKPEESKTPTIGEKIVDAAVPILAGAAAAEVVDFIQDKLHGDKRGEDKKEEPKRPEEKKEKELDFTQIEDRLFGNQKLGEAEKKELEDLRQQRIDEFKKLDQGRFSEELSISVRRTLRDNDWDDVYDELLQVGRNFETQMRGRSEIPDHLNGIAQSAVRYESARVLKSGIVKQTRNLGGYDKAKEWIKDKKADQYSDDELVKIDELAQRSFVHLAPDAPEELVGKNLKKEEPVVPQDNEEVEALNQELEELRSRVNGGDQTVTVDMLREIMGQGSREEIKRLYRDAEKGMYQIPSGFEVPKFLIGESKELQDLWQARARLSSACFMKRMAQGPDDLSKNTEAQAMTNEQLESLLNMRGVLEAVSLESYFIISKESINTITEQLSQAGRLDKNGKIQAMPESLNKIKEGRQLEGFREAKVQWLQVFRGLSREEAEDAEVVSRNLIYLANVFEDYDTRYQWKKDDPDDENSKARLRYIKDYKFTPPTVPQLKSLNAWQLIHPQERLQAKTESGDEAWSLFGVYTLTKFKISKEVDQTPIVGSIAKFLTKIPVVGNMLRNAGVGWSVSNELLFPTRLIPNAFEHDVDGDGETFLKTFFENGEKMFKDTSTRRSDPRTTALALPNFSGDIGEGPFAGYSFLKISPATTIFNVITNPSKFDRNWSGLGNALRNCEVPVYYREKIVLGIHGIVPGLPFLRPINGNTAYEGTKGAVISSDPNFYS